MDCLLYHKTKVQHLYFPEPFSASINWEAIVDDLNRFVNNRNANRRPSRRRARRAYNQEEIIDEVNARPWHAHGRPYQEGEIALEQEAHQFHAMNEDGVQINWMNMEDLNF